MFTKTRTSNGLTVIVSPMKHMTSVSIGIWIGIGGRFEPENKSGISHLVEHMLFKGTISRTAKDLKEAVEGIGGSFNGFTSDEVTCYMVKVPEKYLELGLDILSDMVLDPKFDESDLAREKQVVCEEIKMYRDQPADHVLDVLAQTMWPGDPLGRPLTGNLATVKGINKKDLLLFKNKNYHPGNVAVVVAGKADPQKVTRYARKIFGKEKKGMAVSFKSPVVGQKKACMKIVRGDTKQVHIAMGFHAPGETVRERFAFKLMNVMLGGNMSSRLFEELREKNGLCYDIASSYKRHSDRGELHVHAGVDSNNTRKTITAILDELRKMKDLGVTEDELARAKEYTKGQFLLAMEGTSSRMMWLGDRFMVHRRIPELRIVLNNIDRVTAGTVKKAAESVFFSSGLNLAMVGNLNDRDRTKIRKEIERL